MNGLSPRTVWAKAFGKRRDLPLAGILLVFLIPSVINFSPALLERLTAGTKLTGAWELCPAPEGAECSWTPTQVPGKLSLPAGAGEIYLRTRFVTPEECLKDLGGCDLLIGTLSDPTDVFLNGRQIGRVGTPPPAPQYSQTYPGHFFIPSPALNRAGENQFVLRMFLGQSGVHGITRSPIAVLPSRQAGLLAESLTAGTVFLPLVSAFTLFMLIFMTNLSFGWRNGTGKDLAAYKAYCAFAAIYLVSLSRLPREYLPRPAGYAIHFGLRFLLEWFLFSFVAAFFSAPRSLTGIVRGLLVALSLACFATILDPSARVMGINSLVYNGILICLTTSLLGLYWSFNPKTAQDRATPVIRAFFVGLALMQSWDILALRGAVPDVYFGRFSPAIIGIFFGSFFWSKAIEERRRTEVDAQLGMLASQIAHDVRSPLAALEMVGNSLQELPEDKRVMVRSAVSRIKDIANNLLAKRGSGEGISPRPAEGLSHQLLSTIIDEIVTEKHFQYRARLGVTIDFQANRLTYGLFANVDSVEMKRVMSNLINNSVEALGEAGAVHVSLVRSGGFVEIRVQDNGKGIPPEVLPRLMQRGVTCGKSDGSGLGLFHARTTVESWDGSLAIESKVGEGTQVTVRLPRAEPPSWFVRELVVPERGVVVVLDDDYSIHQIWDGRFEALQRNGYRVEVVHFARSVDLETWVREQPEAASRALYLVDYEFLGARMTGLDLIEKLGIQARSILVTSRYEEPRVRDRCSVNQLKLIPKGMAGFVPIAVEQPLKSVDAILIDDDPLIHMMWAASARRHGLRLDLFSSSAEFRTAVPSIDRATSVYIDSSLSGGEKGEALAKELSEMGFTELYLATGYSPEQFPPMPWIKGILGKEPVWDTNEAPVG